jgi:hypothetical protein
MTPQPTRKKQKGKCKKKNGRTVFRFGFFFLLFPFSFFLSEKGSAGD